MSCIIDLKLILVQTYSTSDCSKLLKEINSIDSKLKGLLAQVNCRLYLIAKQETLNGIELQDKNMK